MHVLINRDSFLIKKHNNKLVLKLDQLTLTVSSGPSKEVCTDESLHYLQTWQLIALWKIDFSSLS